MILTQTAHVVCVSLLLHHVVLNHTKGSAMHSNCTNTLRIGIRELNALLDKIESLQSKKTNPNREFVRWNFRIVRADLTIEHATGSKVILPVATRNISRGGISVLHSAFIHPNSRCHFTAKLDDGRKLDMNGSVLRCSHLGGKVHEVGIKFDNEISTKDLLGLDPIQEAYSLECIDPVGLHGNVLIVAKAQLDQQLLLNLLNDTSLTIMVADNSENALKKAQKGCELIITDYSIGEDSAADILMTLRAQGIDAPVLVMTSDASSDIHDELRMSGASGLISKPFSRDKLLQALAEFLLSDGDSGPLYSTLQPSSPANEILPTFLTELPRLILTLEKALRESDATTCQSICTSLASSAAPLGFESVGHLAVKADNALTKDHAVRDAAADLRQLIIACRRIKSKPRVAA